MKRIYSGGASPNGSGVIFSSLLGLFLNWNRKSIKWLLLFSIVIMMTGILVVFLLQRDATYQSKEFLSPSSMASGKGVSFFESYGEEKVYRVSIDNFSVEGARLGPFAIGPLVVAHLNKVTVDLYLEGIESRLKSQKIGKGGGRLAEWAFLDFERPISNIRKNLPSKIKSIKLDTISFNLWKSEKKSSESRVTLLQSTERQARSYLPAMSRWMQGKMGILYLTELGGIRIQVCLRS